MLPHCLFDLYYLKNFKQKDLFVNLYIFLNSYTWCIVHDLYFGASCTICQDSR